MISTVRFGWTRLPMLAAGLSLSMGLAAGAETPVAEAVQADIETTVTADADDADLLKDIDVSKLDWSQLNIDPSTADALVLKGPAKSQGDGNDPVWSSNLKANGTSAVAVKQSISPFWDTRVGVDMTVAKPDPQTTSERLAERLANGGSAPQSSGSAWASVTAPGVASIWDKTSVEARVNAGSDQSQLGASLSKDLPFDEGYSLTLQNGYNVIQQGAFPVPGIISRPTRDYATDQSAKLDVIDTGTSFLAGQTLSTADDKWLRKVGAEQKLFDGVTVTGSIGETAQGTTNKSISAGYKRSW